MEPKSIVGVCGNEARVYGERDEKSGIRPLKQIRQFVTRGQALQFANDYEDRGRNPKPLAKKK